MQPSRMMILTLGLAGAVLATPLAQPWAMLRAETAGAAMPGSGAVTAPGIRALMRFDALFDILAEEGIRYGDGLEAGMFPGRGGQAWAGRVEALYRDPAVLQRFDAAFDASLAARPEALPGIAAFFDSELGRRIVQDELAARRSLLDEAATEAAEVAAEKLQAERAPRLRLIHRLIAAGDTVEYNVAITMTGLLAFDRGLAETTPARQLMPEADRQAGIWNDEDGIRIATVNWLVSYMVLAYSNLTDEEVKAYTAFFASPEGKALNAALMAGAEAALTPVMHDLGREAGRTMQGRGI